MTPNVSGTIVSEHRKLFAERLGSDLVDRALAKLPTDVRGLVIEAMPSGWIPLSAFESAYEVVAKEAERDVPGFHTEIGRLAIERTFSSVWRVLLRVTTDNALVTRTPVIFSKSYDCGKLVARIDKPGEAQLVLTEWPDVGEFPLRSLSNGVVTVLRLAGRKGVEWRAVDRTADGALMSATWRS